MQNTTNTITAKVARRITPKATTAPKRSRRKIAQDERAKLLGRPGVHLLDSFDMGTADHGEFRSVTSSRDLVRCDGSAGSIYALFNVSIYKGRRSISMNSAYLDEADARRCLAGEDDAVLDGLDEEVRAFLGL